MKGIVMKRKMYCVLPALAALAFLAFPAAAFAEGLEIPGITPADFAPASPEAHWFWSVLGSSAVASILAAAGKIIKNIIASIKDARLARACQFVWTATTLTYQEYVRVVKAASADGKLTLDEKNEALEYAYRKAVEIARTEGFDILKVLGKELIMALIEKYVGQTKAGAVVAPLPALPDLLPSGS